MKEIKEDIEDFKKMGFSQVYYKLYLTALDWENGKISNEDYADKMEKIWNDWSMKERNKEGLL